MTIATDAFINGLYSAISLERSYIKLLPKKILLFGGSLAKPEQGVATKASIPRRLFRGWLARAKKGEAARASIRRRLIDHCERTEAEICDALVLPEAFLDWGKDARYEDLLSLESDLSDISTLICIIPESPGSFAELGAFAVNPRVQARLAVLMSWQHYQADSFINNALLRRLDNSQIITYDWSPETLEPIDDFFDGIIRNISDISDGHKGEKFQPDNFGHKAFCIFQLVHDLEPVRLVEIRHAIDALGLKLEENELTRILYLLTRLSFIDSIRPGRSEYYLVDPKNQSIRVDYKSRPKTPPFDRDRFTIEIQLEYRKERKVRGDRDDAMAAFQKKYAP